jgi:hypothetical protein
VEGVTRERLLARQRRAAVVAARLNAAGTPAGTVVALRCEQPHTGGRPVLAKLFATEQGMLFFSRIAWLPSDQLNRRPWDAESLLLSLDVTHWPDDEELACVVKSLTGPIFVPPEGPGPRWLLSVPPAARRWGSSITPDPSATAYTRDRRRTCGTARVRTN